MKSWSHLELLFVLCNVRHRPIYYDPTWVGHWCLSFRDKNKFSTYLFRINFFFLGQLFIKYDIHHRIAENNRLLHKLTQYIMMLFKAVNETVFHSLLLTAIQFLEDFLGIIVWALGILSNLLYPSRRLDFDIFFKFYRTIMKKM